MRWKRKMSPPSPRNGELRIIRRFLLLPRKIDFEFRWLEFATIEQKYYDSWYDSSHNYHETLGWCDNRWCNCK